MRNLSLDYLKLALAVMVVLLHAEIFLTSRPVLGFALVNGLFRLAVPLFVMITGYYFTTITTGAQLKRWLKRLFILYAVWMILYTPLWLDIEHPKYTLAILLTGFQVLWYLPGVFFAGLMLYFVRNQKPAYLLAAAIILYVIGYLIQCMANIGNYTGALKKLFDFLPLYRNAVFDCFPMMVMGYLIKRCDVEKRWTPSVTVLVLALVILLGESMLNYRLFGVKAQMDFLASLLFAGPVVFLFVKGINIPGTNKSLANLATAIFFIQPLFLNVYDILAVQFPRAGFVLVLSVLMAFIVVQLNKRVKVLL